MKIEFDLKKSEKNVKERGLPFDWVLEFDWETAFYEVDERKDYNESRLIATGFLGERLHVDFLHCEIIRKWHELSVLEKRMSREVKRYEKKKNTHQ